MAIVTIGIPVYNEVKYLVKTIESAINQDLKDIEIIISDNCSTDGSIDIIKKYSQIDSRIKAIYLEQNFGGQANFASLLNNTTSKYFVMLGAHDIFLPHYAGDAVSFLEQNPDYVMAYPESKLVDRNEEALNYSDSDIDSDGLCLTQRMCKVAKNLSWCTCFHGVFRSEVIRQLPVLKIRGADHLLLFASAYYGKIHWMRKLGILRRESRNESPEEIEYRRIKSGVYDENNGKFYNSWSVMAMEHCMYVLEKTKLHLFHKISLVFLLMMIFKRRFSVSFSSILFAYNNRGGSANLNKPLSGKSATNKALKWT